MKRSLVLTAVAILAVSLSVLSADEKQSESRKKGPGRKPVTTSKCPIGGKELKIVDAKVVDYKKAKIYVCCDGCKAKIEKDATPYAAKLN